MLALSASLVAAPAVADETNPTYTELDICRVAFDNISDQLAYMTGQRDYWQAAEERVAEAAVQRNIEYAAVVRKNEVLRNKVRDLRARLQAAQGR